MQKLSKKKFLLVTTLLISICVYFILLIETSSQTTVKIADPIISPPVVACTKKLIEYNDIIGTWTLGATEGYKSNLVLNSNSYFNLSGLIESKYLNRGHWDYENKYLTLYLDKDNNETWTNLLKETKNLEKNGFEINEVNGKYKLILKVYSQTTGEGTCDLTLRLAGVYYFKNRN